MDSFGIDKQGPPVPAHIKAYCTALVRLKSPYATGSLMFDGIKMEQYQDSSFEILIDPETHRYGIKLDEWDTLGGWKRKASSIEATTAKLTGQKKKNASDEELKLRSKKYTPGEKANYHKGWFSERALDEVMRYLQQYYNGRVMY